MQDFPIPLKSHLLARLKLGDEWMRGVVWWSKLRVISWGGREANTVDKQEFARRVSNGIKKKLKSDVQFRKQWSEKSRKGAKSVNERYVFSFKDRQKATKKRLAYYQIERELIESMKNDDNEIFPNIIIDAIEFKNGTLTFIEIKANSGRLSKRQQQFRDLVDSVKEVRFKTKKISL